MEEWQRKKASEYEREIREECIQKQARIDELVERTFACSKMITMHLGRRGPNKQREKEIAELLEWAASWSGYDFS